MKKLYLFDFDGTLTYKDTMFLYLQFYNEKKYFWNFLKHIPLFVLVKLHLANAEKVKKSFISSILKGEREEKINFIIRPQKTIPITKNTFIIEIGFDLYNIFCFTYSFNFLKINSGI